MNPVWVVLKVPFMIFKRVDNMGMEMLAVFLRWQKERATDKIARVDNRLRPLSRITMTRISHQVYCYSKTFQALVTSQAE
jgi:hypothetical protein